MSLVTADNSSQALQATTSVFTRISHTVFNPPSLIVLVVSLAIALVLGRVLASLLRRVVTQIGQQADRSQNLRTVNRLRRTETYIVLSIAVLKVLLVLFALYFWWAFVHPAGQPTAIIGASALAVIIISGALSPVLRDVAAGSFMMAEQWYGVGDHIRVEPFDDMQGVVERVTLRSTRIRGLNGEVIWISNQNIQGIRLSPKGIRTIALEIFVDDVMAGERLINLTNQRLPVGPLLVVKPLEIISSEKVGDQLWHITAIGQSAPGREWLLENSAVELIKWLDEQTANPAIAHGPLARSADSEADRRFARTIRNAQKTPAKRKRMPIPKPRAKSTKK